MNPRRATPTAASPREPPSRTFPTPGSARCAERASVTSSPTRTERGARSAGLTLAYDREHVWPPYGPLPGSAEPLLVDAAEGVRIILKDGRELIDGMASWWCAIHGYRHPELDAALEEQLART